MAALGTLEFKVSGITDMTRLPLVYAPAHYAVAAAVALASSLVAGFFPARKVARLFPRSVPGQLFAENACGTRLAPQRGAWTL